MTNNCSNLYLLSAAACKLGECLEEEELERLSSDLRTLGYLIENMIVHKTECEKRKEQLSDFNIIVFLHKNPEINPKQHPFQFLSNPSTASPTSLKWERYCVWMLTNSQQKAEQKTKTQYSRSECVPHVRIRIS